LFFLLPVLYYHTRSCVEQLCQKCYHIGTREAARGVRRRQLGKHLLHALKMPGMAAHELEHLVQLRALLGADAAHSCERAALQGVVGIVLLQAVLDRLLVLL